MGHHAKFVWDDSYSVQIQEIDEQHQEFFGIINSIYDLLEKENITNANLIAAAAKLGDYAHYHLSTEEEYFQEFDYPEAAAHIKEHDMFRQKMMGYMDKAETDGPDLDVKGLVEEIATFAKDWLSGHIFTVDKKYIECFHQHGLN